MTESNTNSENLQPPGAIEPMAAPGAAAREEITDPAKLDYKQGRDHLGQESWAEAAACFHNALKGFEEQGDDPGIASSRDRLGDVCMGMDDYAKALEHYAHSMTVCRKLDDVFSCHALNKKIAVCHRRLGDLDMAMDFCLEIFDHHREVRNPKGTVEILEVMAEIYQEKGDMKGAIDCLRTIVSIHKNFKHPDQAAEYEERAAALGA